MKAKHHVGLAPQDVIRRDNLYCLMANVLRRKRKSSNEFALGGVGKIGPTIGNCYAHEDREKFNAER